MRKCEEEKIFLIAHMFIIFAVLYRKGNRNQKKGGNKNE